MADLTPAQRLMLKKMHGARVVTRLDTGEVLVVFGHLYQGVKVIDTKGRVFAFGRYLALLDRRSQRSFAPEC